MNRTHAFTAISLALLFGCRDASSPPAPAPSLSAEVERGEKAQHSEQDVRFSFVVVGCNRVDKADTALAYPSTANIEQLTRTFREVAALSPLPRFVFLAGDIVYGYTADTVRLA